MVLLDTHVWLWWLLGDGRLANKHRQSLDDLAEHAQVAVSWVSVWETEMLERKGRIQLLPDFATWTRQATDASFIQLWPVDLELVICQRRLPDFFHPDPADRLITCSALLAQVPLATFDQKIIDADLVPIWGGAK